MLLVLIMIWYGVVWYNGISVAFFPSPFPPSAAYFRFRFLRHVYIRVTIITYKQQYKTSKVGSSPSCQIHLCVYLSAERNQPTGRSPSLALAG